MQIEYQQQDIDSSAVDGEIHCKAHCPTDGLKYYDSDKICQDSCSTTYADKDENNTYLCTDTCSSQCFIQEGAISPGKVCTANACKSNTGKTLYFREGDSGYYECVSSCDTVTYKFQDSSAVDGEIHCKAHCPTDGLKYYDSDKICQDSCSTTYADKDENNTYLCTDTCSSQCFIQEGAISPGKVCTANACKSNTGKTLYFREGDSGYYECVSSCDTVTYKFQDSSAVDGEIHCKAHCPTTGLKYYDSDKICQDSCSNYALKDANDTYACSDSCDPEFFFKDDNNVKICSVACKSTTNRKTSYFREGDSGYYECVQYCDAVTYKFLDSDFGGFDETHCRPHCPTDGLKYYDQDKICQGSCSTTYADKDENNTYLCTDTCSSQYFIQEATISPGKVCVATSCADSDYKYSLDPVNDYTQCLVFCPEDKKYFDSDKVCQADCGAGYDKYYLPTQKDGKTTYECVDICPQTANYWYASNHYCINDCTKTSDPRIKTDQSGYSTYQCLEGCPSEKPFLDEKTDSNNPECLAFCPETYNHYKSDKKCISSCDNTYVKLHKPSTYNTFECLDACEPKCYYLDSSIHEDKKICMEKECNDESSTLKNYYRKDSDTTDYYRCVDKCAKDTGVDYKYQDNKNDETKSFCRQRCPDNVQYFVEDDQQECLPQCPVEKPKVDNYTTTNNTYKCVNECPSDPQLYEDSLTFGVTFCIPSCKALNPIAYLDKDEKKCVRECKATDGLFIDFTEDPNKPYLSPKCTTQCPASGLKYIDQLTNSSEKRCVSSCKELIPTAFIDTDGKTCTRKCTGKFISTDKDNNPICVAKCGDTEYIDQITDSDNPKCVSSCKLLNPSAFIKNKNEQTAPFECTFQCAGGEVLDISDTSKPECKSECPTHYYINEEYWYNKSTQYRVCVQYCSALNPPKYIPEQGNVCTDKCEHYISDFPGDNPKCVEECSSSYFVDDITYKDKKICVASCNSLKVPAYEDNTNKKCVYTCPDGIELISLNKQKCVSNCESNEYVQVINNIGYCVSSCKDLVPTAYIYRDYKFKPKDTEYTVNLCMTACGESKTCHDSLSDSSKPECAANCDSIGYIDELTDKNKKVCTKSCKDLVPVAYIYNKTSPYKCVTTCPDEAKYLKYIYDENDKEEFQFLCTETCDANYYIDELTNSSQPACVKSCRALIPEAYLNKEDKKCVEKCDGDNPFIQYDSDTGELACVSECDGSEYIDNISKEGLQICVPYCKDLIPSAFIFENSSDSKNYCVRNCTETDKHYVFNKDDDKFKKPTCMANCGDQLIDLASVDKRIPYQINCVKSCKNLIPTAYVYTDLDDNNYKKCVNECPSEVPYVDSTDEDHPKCASDCPTIDSDNPNAGYYYIDNVTTIGVKMCVKSCKLLNPTAYIYNDPDNGDKETCLRQCPIDMPYVNIEDEHNPKCDNKCYTSADSADTKVQHYIDDELTTPGLKICVKSCYDLEPRAFIYADPDIDNKQKCVRTCPYKAKYVDPTEKYYPKCADKCPDDGDYKYIDNELTTEGLKICVKSCKNLEPIAYIYEDPDNNDYKTCVRYCPDEVPYVSYDFDNPQCVDECYDKDDDDATKYYIDDLTTPGKKLCVPSCKLLNPLAYIYEDPDLANKLRCVRVCPEDKPFVDQSDPQNPTCVNDCPEGWYLDDEVTTPGLKICVKSCKNLLPSAYIYNDPDLTTQTNKNRCVRSCPEEKPYVDQTAADAPECKADCPTTDDGLKYLDNGVTSPGLKICVDSCKNLGTLAFIYVDPDNNNMETCVRKCPESSKYVDYSDKDYPKCKTTCPDNFYIDELTSGGVSMCVRSCKELNPVAYVYEDSDLTCNNKKRCVRACPAKKPYIQFDKSEQPVCETECNATSDYKYIDELSVEGVKMCVKSCQNMKHNAYIFDNGEIKKCVYQCPESKKYVDYKNPSNPQCSDKCYDKDDGSAIKYYIDDLTVAGLSKCVLSCKNLVPSAYIYNDEQCVRVCPDDKKYVSTDVDNPQCISKCEDTEYIDENTIEGVSLCVKSCKHIKPLAYIVKTDAVPRKCIVNCSKITGYTYFDAITDVDNPSCMDSCGDNYAYTDIMTDKYCVKSCGDLNTIRFEHDCVDECPDSAPYIDNNSTEDEYKNPKCVSECPDDYYINSLTDSKAYCVNSCKNLEPTAFIDASDEEHKKCTWECPANYPYIDESTDINHPVCVSVCPDDQPYIYDTENRGMKVCVDSCFKTLKKTLIDKITTFAKPQCVQKCNLKTAPNLDRITDPINPICLSKCPSETAKFLDAITDPEAPVCLFECDKTAPYDDLVTDPDEPKCLKECLPGTYLNGTHCLACESPCSECVGNATNCTACKENFYLLENSCLETCPDGMQQDKNKWVCDSCYKTCKTCTGGESTDCLTCITNYIFTKSNKCENQDDFIVDEYNLETEKIDTFDQFETKIEQINNIGNLEDDTPYSTIQSYMVSTVSNSVEYLNKFVETQNNFSDIENQAKLSTNLQKLTNISVELPVDDISTVVSTVIKKIDITTSNQTIVKNLFKTNNNILKFMKKGAKRYNQSSVSHQTTEKTVFGQIDMLGNLGLQLISKKLKKTNRRMLESVEQIYAEYDQYSMLLTAESTESEKWIGEVDSSNEKDNFFYYEINAEIDYSDMNKIAVNYPKGFVKELLAKIPENDNAEEILVKVISYNYLRSSSNEYKEALFDNQQIYGSVMKFSFQYQEPETYALTTIDATDLEAYITVKVPINYKLNGDEDLQCMAYDEDDNLWKDDDIVTGDKTDTYVICKTRKFNAITVIAKEKMEFKKNYALYFSCFQLPLLALIFILVFSIKNEESEGQIPLSFSPFFSALRASTSAHAAAKCLLFSFQLALIEFFIAVFFNFNHDLNDGEVTDAVLCILFSVIIGWVGKYFFGIILNYIYKQPASCLLYTMFMALCYTGLCVGTCYIVSNPEYDNFYNVGLYSTLIALGIDFIGLDLLIVLVLTILKLRPEQLKGVAFGGYLSIYHQSEIVKDYDSCKQEDIQPSEPQPQFKQEEDQIVIQN